MSPDGVSKEPHIIFYCIMRAADSLKLQLTPSHSHTRTHTQTVTLMEGGGGLRALINACNTIGFFFQKSVLMERNFCWPNESYEHLESDVSYSFFQKFVLMDRSFFWPNESNKHLESDVSIFFWHLDQMFVFSHS